MINHTHTHKKSWQANSSHHQVQESETTDVDQLFNYETSPHSEQAILESAGD